MNKLFEIISNVKYYTSLFYKHILITKTVIIGSFQFTISI